MQLVQTDLFGENVEIDLNGELIAKKKSKQKKVTLVDAILFARNNNVSIYSVKNNTGKFLVRGEVSYEEVEGYNFFADSDYVREYFDYSLDDDNVTAKELIKYINEQNKPKKNITLKAAIKQVREGGDIGIWATKDKGRFIWKSIAKFEEFPDSFFFANAQFVKEHFEQYAIEMTDEGDGSGVALLSEDDVVQLLINWINGDDFYQRAWGKSS